MKEPKIITSYMESLRGRILETATKAFVANGIKAVKMDDVAQSMGISKRTLYEIYTNKETLLYACMKEMKERKRREYEEVFKESSNVMDVILKMYRLGVDEFKLTSPEFYDDMAKYPSVIQLFREDNLRTHDNLIRFMQRGVDEGYFRKDVNLELVSMVFSALSKYINENQLYKNYSIEELFHNLVFVSIRGFCTPKGVELLEKHLDHL